MKVETRSPLSYEQKDTMVIDSGQIFSSSENQTIDGLSREDDIYVSNMLNPISWILTFSHEVGHFLGSTISFTNGSILSPNEIQGTRISLTKPERKLLQEGIANLESTADSTIHSFETLSEIGRKLIETLLTINVPELAQLTVHNMSPQQLIETLRNGKLTTGEVFPDGKIVFTDHKSGRNAEIPSTLFEVSCAQILENTLVHYRIINPDIELVILGTVLPHQRAQNIVARAFKYNYLLPSVLDLESCE